jgi:hypothetical protein
MVKVVLHGTAHRHADRRIFVAKAELSRIPFFGKAARAIGTITAGVPIVPAITHDDRDTLAATVRDRMEAFLHEHYGTPVTLSRLETSVHGA